MAPLPSMTDAPLDFEGEEHRASPWWREEGTDATPVTPTDQHSSEGNTILWDSTKPMVPLPSMADSSSPAPRWVDRVVSTGNGHYQTITNHDAASPMSGIGPQRCDSPNYVRNLALLCDKDNLTPYQMVLRQSLQYFSATQHDVDARVRGRKQKIRLGQIGVQCRYCAHLRVSDRGKGSVYFPKTLVNVYQAAQNIAGAHFNCDDYICPFVPIDVVLKLDVQRPKRDASKGGRAYWLQSCSSIGIYEEDKALWLHSTKIEQDKAMNLA